MRGKVRAGCGGEAEAYLDHQHAHNSAARREHVLTSICGQAAGGRRELAAATGRGEAQAGARAAWARQVCWWCTGGRGEQPRCEKRLTGLTAGVRDTGGGPPE